MRSLKTVSLCLLLAFWPRIGVAQSKEFRHVEVGALAGFLDLNTINGEKPLTLGLRAGYRVNTAFGVEGEWVKCPSNGVGKAPNPGSRILFPAWFCL